MIFIDELDLVGNHVGADFPGVEKVYYFSVCADVEPPVAEQALSKAVHGLVGLYPGGRSEGVEVGDETGHCQRLEA